MSATGERNQVWRMPLVLGLLSAIGLASALFSDGIGDWVSWLALGAPVAASVWYGLRRGPGRSPQSSRQNGVKAR